MPRAMMLPTESGSGVQRPVPYYFGHGLAGGDADHGVSGPSGTELLRADAVCDHRLILLREAGDAAPRFPAALIDFLSVEVLPG